MLLKFRHYELYTGHNLWNRRVEAVRTHHDIHISLWRWMVIASFAPTHPAYNNSKDQHAPHRPFTRPRNIVSSARSCLLRFIKGCRMNPKVVIGYVLVTATALALVPTIGVILLTILAVTLLLSGVHALRKSH